MRSETEGVRQAMPNQRQAPSTAVRRPPLPPVGEEEKFLTHPLRTIRAAAAWKPASASAASATAAWRSRATPILLWA